MMSSDGALDLSGQQTSGDAILSTDQAQVAESSDAPAEVSSPSDDSVPSQTLQHPKYRQRLLEYVRTHQGRLSQPWLQRFEQMWENEPYVPKTLGDDKRAERKLGSWDKDAHAKAEASRKLVPKFLCCSYSLFGIAHSGGICSPIAHIPQAYKSMHVDVDEKLYDKHGGDAGRMITLELARQNRKIDQFLPWTTSWLRAIADAIRRHEVGQRGIYLCWGKPSSLRTFNDDTPPFYRASIVHEVYGQSSEWSEFYKKFTEGYLSFGILLDPDSAFVHVDIEDVVEQGLFELVPMLEIKGTAPRSDFWTHYTAIRNLNFLKKDVKRKALTIEECIIADRLAKLFKKPKDTKAPLWLFLNFLALRARDMSNVEKFQAWIQEHYCASDMDDLIYDNMHRVPRNIPENEEVLILLRTAMDVFKMQPIPDTWIEMSTPMLKRPYETLDASASLKDFWPQILIDIMNGASGNDKDSRALRIQRMRESKNIWKAKIKENLDLHAGRMRRRMTSREVMRGAVNRGRAIRNEDTFDFQDSAAQSSSSLSSEQNAVPGNVLEASDVAEGQEKSLDAQPQVNENSCLGIKRSGDGDPEPLSKMPKLDEEVVDGEASTQSHLQDNITSG